jgi:hypothetical protein
VNTGIATSFWRPTPGIASMSIAVANVNAGLGAAEIVGVHESTHVPKLCKWYPHNKANS